jgi:hypothetical protein
MLGALDNYSDGETEALLMALVGAAGRGEPDAAQALREMAELARRLEAVEEDIVGGAVGGEVELAYDELRALRARLRMWAKEGERWVAGGTSEDAGGEPGWLGWLRSMVS